MGVCSSQPPLPRAEPPPAAAPPVDADAVTVSADAKSKSKSVNEGKEDSVPATREEREKACAAWLEAQTGESLEGGLVQGIRQGAILCRLVNTLRPGTIKRKCISDKRRRSSAISNLEAFCTALGTLGFEANMIPTATQLQAGSNPTEVVALIEALMANSEEKSVAEEDVS